MRIMKRKKGQEEIMGFILIIVMIVVIGLFMLFFMKAKVNEEKDFQLDNLIEALLKTSVGEKNVEAMIKDCESGENCKMLEGNLTGIIDVAMEKSGMVIGKNIKGSEFNISGGMEYYYLKGNVTSRSLASANVVRNSLIKMKVYY